ncbi:MAG TPA: 5-oxoprolinase subunit PxpB [Burkholderiales bacterium]|nr:5-oxoprolinase subunit PxpB [Burkholderiales bacterium]
MTRRPSKRCARCAMRSNSAVCTSCRCPSFAINPSCAPEVRACGDTAFVMTFGAQPDPRLTQRMMALRQALLQTSVPGLIEIIPGLTALTFVFDPDITSAHALAALARVRGAGLTDAPPAVRSWTIPVCYDEALAPDLDEIARSCRLTKERIVALHSEREYTVYLIGFSPGFPYLGDIAAELVLPRRAQPRTRVPAGSVAIADRYTAIYAHETPGGWHIVGRTPWQLFDACRASPSLLQAGDIVRFQPVDRQAFDELAAGIASGTYVPCPAEPRR